ncbi:helix-turn-helix domain-containing protein [Microbacterium sp. KNMS]
MTNRKDYLLEVTGARSTRAIAATAGIDPSTLNRQLNGTTSLTVETVVQICRAYSLDMSDVFVGVGFITAEEANHLGRMHSITEYTDLELAREIVRRLEAGEASADLTGELTIEEELAANVPGATQDEDLGRQRDYDRVARAREEDRGEDEGGWHA